MKKSTSLILILCIFVLGASLGTSRAQTWATNWVQTYHDPNTSYFGVTAMVVDTNGNIFVTGSTLINNIYRYETLGYSRDGVPLWTNYYQGPGSTDDETKAIAVDNKGQVIVTGYTGIGNTSDILTIAYSTGGAALWTNRFDGPGNGQDRPEALVVDASGTIFVAGYSAQYALLLAYSASGMPLWTNYLGSEDSWTSANVLTLDGNGSVIVGGSDGDCVTIKYSSGGMPLWTNRYDGPGHNSDGPMSMKADVNGDIIVGGLSYQSMSQDFDFVTLKYSGAGLPLWTNRYQGPFQSSDVIVGMVLDGSGNATVLGNSGDNFVTIKYSAAGVPLWTNLYSRAAAPAWTKYPSGIGQDANGNIFVTGSVPGIGNQFLKDWATIAYSGAGLPLCTNYYNGPANTDDRAGALAIGPDGSVIVAGEANPDVIVMKYRPLLLSLGNGSGGNSGIGITNGHFGFTLSGPPGQTAVILASTNLTDWLPIGTNVLGTDPITFSDPASPGLSSRCYRAAILP